jgi:D-glycero-alpha-D-manno-heptose-7-phosphate kinase
MIITRAPLRISLFGGGSDLPAYFETSGGAVVSMTIDKYVYITIHKNFIPNRITLKYSTTEDVEDVSLIQHRIFKACLTYFDLTGVEISVTSDIPAGTGMGSSSSFIVALLKAISDYLELDYSNIRIIELACHIELEILKEPIGKQDQYASGLGGLNLIEFRKSGEVSHSNITFGSKEGKEKLLTSMLLYYSGFSRSASQVLKSQKTNMTIQSKRKLISQLVDYAYDFETRAKDDDLTKLGLNMNHSWELKRNVTDKISNQYFDTVYSEAINCGAIGGKLLGAGGGGFFLFIIDPTKRESFMRNFNRLERVDFNLTDVGVETIFNG